MPDAHSPSAAGPVVFAVATTPERRGIERLRSELRDASTVDFLQTGVGPLELDAIYERLAQASARGLVSVGTCGALDPVITCGTVIMPESVTDGNATLPVDSSWRSRVVDALSPSINTHAGLLITMDRVIRSADEKRRIHAETGAIAVDMETATLQRAASRAGIPFIALRAVLDARDEIVPGSVTSGVDRAGRPTPLRLMASLLRHPRDIPGLLRIASALRTANAALDTAARRAAAALVEPN